MDNMLERLKGGLIVSCYAGADFNAEMAVPETMVCVAKSCIAGGAKAIRTNCENVAAVKAAVDVPVIGLKKIYRSGDMISGDFRITPTLKEVEELIKAGADGVAVDGTVRERYDGKTLPLWHCPLFRSVRHRLPRKRKRPLIPMVNIMQPLASRPAPISG